MDIVGAHMRAQQRARPMAEPIRAMHDALAYPFWRAYAWLGSAPATVQLQVLLLSGASVLGMAAGTYAALAAGVLMAHLGHILTLAARRLAPNGVDAWTHVLEQAVGRTIEVGLLGMLTLAAVRGVPGAPSWFPDTVEAGAAAPALGVAAVGALFVWRLVRQSSDLHLLRAALHKTRRVPGPVLLSGPQTVNPLPINRERILTVITLGTLAAQPALTLAAVAGLGLWGTVGGIAGFRRRMADPEPRASEVVGKGYENL